MAAASTSRSSPATDSAHGEDRGLDLPSRLLLDTCILNRLYNEGGYVFDGGSPISGNAPDSDLEALRLIMAVNQRAAFQLLVSLTVAEIANTQEPSVRNPHLSWVLEVLDHWLTMLDEGRARIAEGGTVRHRFKLTLELQAFEASLMEIADFRRDPFDRLLLVQYRLGTCDAFLTTDRDTIWCHRAELSKRGVQVLTPADYWELLRPWAPLWL